jgi:hypothetical protein
MLLKKKLEKFEVGSLFGVRSKKSKKILKSISCPRIFVDEVFEVQGRQVNRFH